MQMTEADESLSNYRKCNKLLHFCCAGFQNCKCIVYVMTHLSRSLLIVCFQEIKFRQKWSFVCNLILSDVSGILTVDLHGKMDMICSTVFIWLSHLKYKEDHLLWHCWTTSIFTLERTCVVAVILLLKH